MVIDFGDDAAAFWRAYLGKGKRPRKQAHQLRPDIPRAGRARAGEGGREKDLATLARAGFTVTHQQHGEHWLSNPGTGAETPRCSSYRAALDAAIALLQSGAERST